MFQRLGQLERELAEIKQQLGLDRGISAASPVSGDLDPAILNLLVHYASDFLAVHSADGRYLFASDASRDLFGWLPDDLIGRSIYEFIHPDDADGVASNHARHGTRQGTRTSEYRMRCRDGGYRWVESRSHAHVDEAGVRQIVCVNRDVTDYKAMVEKLQHTNQALKARSMRDPLTGMPNRRRLKDRLGQLMREARRGRQFSCAILDLDHFKVLNDRFGHAAGDEVLRSLARLLRRNVRDVDLVARYGGEEFVILFVDMDQHQAACALEDVRQIAARSRLGPAPVTFSAGVAGYTADLETGQALFERADRALYQAKHLGRNRICQSAGELPAKALAS